MSEPTESNGERGPLRSVIVAGLAFLALVLTADCIKVRMLTEEMARDRAAFRDEIRRLVESSAEVQRKDARLTRDTLREIGRVRALKDR